MSDRTQEIKNLRAVATACKSYTDKVAKDLQWQLGTYDLSVDTVNGTTSLLPTPANTIQATMVRIDGASEVSENLMNVPNKAETTVNGMTYSINSDVITLNGTSTADSLNPILSNYTLPNGTYTISYEDDNTYSHLAFYKNGTLINGNVNKNNTTTFTIETGDYISVSLYIKANVTCNNKKYIPMIVYGSTAPTSFKPYYSGIHNLELSGLVVESENIKDFPDNPETTRNGVTYSTIDGTLTINGTASEWTLFKTISFVNPLENVYVRVFGGGTQAGTGGFYTQSVGGSIVYNNNKYFGTGDNALKKIEVFANGGDFLTNRTLKLMIVRSSTMPTTYSRSQTPINVPIDLSSILYNGNPLFEGNSLKAVNDVKDSITPYLATKKIQQYVVTNDTEITQSQEDSGNGIGARIIVPSNVKIDGLILSSLQNYSQITYNSFYTGQQVGFASHNNSANNVVYIRLGAGYDTTQKVKDYLVNNNAIFNFELATPIEATIDLSQLVKFEAYSNGSITLVNTNNQDTTSTFKYLKEVAK